MLPALTAHLFDDVPHDRMAEAEIPAEVSDRLDSTEKLSDGDRETIVKIARRALEEFLPGQVPTHALE